MNHLRLILILLAVVSLAAGVLGQAFGKNVLGSLLLHRRHTTTAPTSRVKFVTQRHTAPRRVSTTRASETKAEVESSDVRSPSVKQTAATKIAQQQQSSPIGSEAAPRKSETSQDERRP